MPGTVSLKILRVSGLVALLAARAVTAEEAIPPSRANDVIQQVIKSMPLHGGYKATPEVTRRMQEAVQSSGGKLQINPDLAKPSYCSEATYLVFLRTLAWLNRGQDLSGPVAESLAVRGQPDGHGVWGRWNANGPGTARLFAEAQLGWNFTSLQEARPGDFMKIFWTDKVGRDEHGHSVIFLRLSMNGPTPTLTFWSSNQGAGYDGYSEKTVPLAKIKAAIFSRLDASANLNNLRLLAPSDPYLASLNRVESSLATAKEMVQAR